jgi:hypothetical protein
MPSLIAFRRSPKRDCTLSRSRWRETRKARVAPMVDAKDTISSPQPRPNRAPPASVITAAPGSDSAVTTT